jgi:hypothetical protein
MPLTLPVKGHEGQNGTQDLLIVGYFYFQCLIARALNLTRSAWPPRGAGADRVDRSVFELWFEK